MHVTSDYRYNNKKIFNFTYLLTYDTKPSTGNPGNETGYSIPETSDAATSNSLGHLD